MTVYFYDRQEKELLDIKADLYIPGVKGMVPHRVIKDVNKEDTLNFDADRYELSYIGR